MIKEFVAPKIHFGCGYMQVNIVDNYWWVMDSSTYTSESFRKVYKLLKVINLRKEKLPSSTVYHPDLDLCPLLGEDQHQIYHQMIGMAEWMVQIGIFEIHYAVTYLNIFSEAPR